MLVLKPAQKIILYFFCFSLAINLSSQITSKASKELKEVLKPKRIEATSYRIILYNQSKDSAYNITMTGRQITKETFNSKPCFRITETGYGDPVPQRINSYIDAVSLKPVYYEFFSRDTLRRKTIFEDNKAIIYNYRDNNETKIELESTSELFLANSFTELVQSNDFSKNPVVRFKTINPGSTPNTYIVERIRKEMFPLPGGKELACYLLKFTRIDSKGVEGSGGYRYVDMKTGKVLMFKSVLDSDTFFTYQLQFLK